MKPGSASRVKHARKRLCVRARRALYPVLRHLLHPLRWPRISRIHNAFGWLDRDARASARCRSGADAGITRHFANARAVRSEGGSRASGQACGTTQSCAAHRRTGNRLRKNRYAGAGACEVGAGDRRVRGDLTFRPSEGSICPALVGRLYGIARRRRPLSLRHQELPEAREVQDHRNPLAVRTREPARRRKITRR